MSKPWQKRLDWRTAYIMAYHHNAYLLRENVRLRDALRAVVDAQCDPEDIAQAALDYEPDREREGATA